MQLKVIYLSIVYKILIFLGVINASYIKLCIISVLNGCSYLNDTANPK